MTKWKIKEKKRGITKKRKKKDPNRIVIALGGIKVKN